MLISLLYLNSLGFGAHVNALTTEGKVSDMNPALSTRTDSNRCYFLVVGALRRIIR